MSDDFETFVDSCFQAFMDSHVETCGTAEEMKEHHDWLSDFFNRNNISGDEQDRFCSEFLPMYEGVWAREAFKAGADLGYQIHEEGWYK